MSGQEVGAAKPAGIGEMGESLLEAAVLLHKTKALLAGNKNLGAATLRSEITVWLSNFSRIGKTGVGK